MDFSDDQEAVVQGVREWANQRSDQILTVGGLAGTGKTTIVSYLVDSWPSAATTALCGKAAHVLRAKGVDAQTVHSLIYVPFETADGKVRFRKRDHLKEIRRIVVDEASMIDHLLFHDLMSFGLPVLFVGDHGQLEPIGTNPNLMKSPNLRLEKIHRQAMDNPILRLAHAFREGRPTPRWKDPNGRLEITGRSSFERLIRPDVQIICGFNKTRHQVNARVREMLGYKHLVQPGEKLICLKNNKAWNIFNGQQVTVLGIEFDSKNVIDLEVETDDGRTLNVPCWKEQFGKNVLEDFKIQSIALMDYGYAMTAHKSQGSEWPDVLIMEEIANVWDAKRWRYTAATRAKERLVYCA